MKFHRNLIDKTQAKFEKGGYALILTGVTAFDNRLKHNRVGHFCFTFAKNKTKNKKKKTKKKKKKKNTFIAATNCIRNHNFGCLDQTQLQK